jgi:hypothetical protein
MFSSALPGNKPKLIIVTVAMKTSAHNMSLYLLSPMSRTKKIAGKGLINVARHKKSKLSVW